MLHAYTHRESNETAGFNIFNASSYLEVKETGNLTLTKELRENQRNFSEERL